MQRRSFLSFLGRATVATAAVLTVPTSALKAVGLTEPARNYAVEALYRLYRSTPRAWEMSSTHVILVGRDFYDAYESELTPCLRFTERDANKPTLAFKGFRVVKDDRRGWRAAFVPRAQAL